MSWTEPEASGAKTGVDAAAAELGIGTLFEKVRDAIVVSDRDGRIVLWNPAAVSLFGYSAEEARGRDVRMVIPERLRERHDQGIRRFRGSGTGPLMESGAVLELPALRKDGSEIVVEMTLSRVEDNVLAIIRDVTERVRLRAAVDADRRRLREANEALESFAYVVGHDLKEPVRAVDAYLDAVAESIRDPEALEALHRAQEANRRMRTLLEGLLEWSRGTITPLDLERTDLETVLRGPCRARYQHMLEERGARIELRGPYPPLQATEGLLCQVFGNLILNAVRHNPRPDPRVVVHALGVEEGAAVVAVRDNGPGIPREVRERIERMRATRPTTVRGGFGMTIALRAAHLLGGRLEIGDADGGGAEIRVYIPVAPA